MISGYTTISGNNTAQTGSHGGGIAIKNSTLSANYMTLSGNATLAGAARGGGVYAENSTINFDLSFISGNSTIGSNSQGGAIAAFNSQVSVTGGSLLSLNSTNGGQSSGAGIFMSGGSLTVTDSQLAQNSTTGQLAGGAAIASRPGPPPTLTRVDFRTNTTSGANSHGGALSNVDSNLVVRDSLLSDNKTLNAQSKGGAVYSDTNLAGTQKTSIVNSTVSGNSAQLRGGGVFNADGLTEIKHSTDHQQLRSLPQRRLRRRQPGQRLHSHRRPVLDHRRQRRRRRQARAATSTRSTPRSLNSFQSLGFNVIGIGNSHSRVQPVRYQGSH